MKRNGVKVSWQGHILTTDECEHPPLSDEQERWMQGILADMVLYGVSLCSGWG
jgi:hypothetical protein